MAELTVLYDEGCEFCTRTAALVGRSPRIEPVAIGSPRGSILLRDLTPSERYASMHVVDDAGRRRSGGAALAPLLRELPLGSVPAAACDAFPGLAEEAYQLVARNRGTFSKLLPF